MTEKHIFPNYGPEETAKRVESILSLAGDKVSCITIDPKYIETILSEKIELPISINIWEHVQQLSQFETLTYSTPPLDSVLNAMGRISIEAIPRFFLLAPDSVLKDEELPKYIHIGKMYQMLFGMIVLEEPRLDEYSFVICGGMGLGYDVASITGAIKGYLGA